MGLDVERRKRPGVDVVTAKSVSKTFSNNGRSIVALENVDLTIAKGEFVCLLGASGCGKSTLLRMIAGFDTPTGGQLQSYGMPIRSPDPLRGVVFQDYALFPWLTVRQNIEFGPLRRGVPRSIAARDALLMLDIVGLQAFAHLYPHQLSGGMKQRVAIARVLVNQSELLLMDEPFGALDALTREQLQLQLLQIWQSSGISVVFVTHSVEEAILLADRVVVMTASPGRIESLTTIDLPRPRDVLSPEFNELRRSLTEKLSSHIRAAHPKPPSISYRPGQR